MPTLRRKLRPLPLPLTSLHKISYLAFYRHSYCQVERQKALLQEALAKRKELAGKAARHYRLGYRSGDSCNNADWLDL